MQTLIIAAISQKAFTVDIVDGMKQSRLPVFCCSKYKFVVLSYLVRMYLS